MNTITLLQPDDWHVHLRDGLALKRTVPDLARQFARAICMPNLVPPVKTVAEAESYRERIMAHVPEGRRIFQQLSVYKNLDLGAFTRKDKEEYARNLEMVYEKFPRLLERKDQIAGTLSGGEQQMLAMGRALMSSPKIILMDEPSMGLSPLFVGEVFKIIEDIKKLGTTVLLVEQNAKKALEIADRAYVLETGKIVLEGDAKDLMNDEKVRKAYLGE